VSRTKLSATVALAACLAATALCAGFAGATHNRYEVQAITIKLDRPARMITGKVFADSTDEHFCTSGGEWPVRLRLARPGKDKTIGFPKNTNFAGGYRFRPPMSVKGKRVYAEVPSYPNSMHGFCVGKRSRTVRSP
jgi:hypothetical protein